MKVQALSWVYCFRTPSSHLPKPVAYAQAKGKKSTKRAQSKQVCSEAGCVFSPRKDVYVLHFLSSREYPYGYSFLPQGVAACCFTENTTKASNIVPPPSPSH